MTIVLALKVGDGLVLGADSASTVTTRNGYHNSYFNAEKLFNLDRRLPLGLLTFGLGGLAGRSVSSHVKDLREALADAFDSRHLDVSSYSVGRAAELVREHFFEGLYKPTIEAGEDAPAMGFIVAGFSAGVRTGEVWTVTINRGGTCDEPRCVVPASQMVGFHVEGQPEAVHRLLLGWAPEILTRLIQVGVPEQDARVLLNATRPLIDSTMPLQDAIDLVDYLVEVTCGFVRFEPGLATVAKPIDTAAITPHEGFRWIHRKHYYPRDLNLPHPRTSE